MPDIIIANPWATPAPTASSGGSSSSGGGSYSAPAQYSGSQTDYDGSVTGVPGTIYQRGPTGAIDVIYRPTATKPSSPGYDYDNNGMDDLTGLALGVTQVPVSLSPTGYLHVATGQPVFANGAAYTAPATAGADNPDLIIDETTGGGVRAINKYTGEVVWEIKAPSASTAQQFGSGTSSGGGGGGGAVASVSSEQKIKEYEAQAAARIAQANAEADAAIRVAQARAKAGDAGDAGAMARLDKQLAASAAQFQQTFGLSLEQFQLQREQFELQRQTQAETNQLNRANLQRSLANDLREAVSTTDPAGFRAWAAGGGFNIGNALQAGPGGAVTDLANLPAARLLQQIEGLNALPATGAGGLGTGVGLGTGGSPAAGGGGGTATGGGLSTPGAETAPTPALAATAGLGPPPEGFATWKDWAAQRYGDLGDISGQMLVDPSAARITRSGRTFLENLIVNPEITQDGRPPSTTPTVTIDSPQAREDYLNRLAYQQYLQSTSDRAKANPYPTADSARMWNLIAQDMGAYNGTGGIGPATPRPSTVAASQAAAAAPGPAIDPSAPGGSIATAYNPGGMVVAGPGNGLVVDPSVIAGGTVTGAGLATGVQRVAQGGGINSPVALTGDARSRNPFADGAKPELLVSRDGRPINADVIPADQTRQILQGRRPMPMSGGGLARAMAMRGRTGMQMMRQPMAPPRVEPMVPRFAEGTISRRTGSTAPDRPPAISPAPAPVAPAPAPTVATRRPTTVQTPAGPATTTGTIPTTTTVAPPTPVTGTATGGGLSSSTTDLAGGGTMTSTGPAATPITPTSTPVQPQTATTPTQTTVPQPVPTTATQPVPTTTATGGGLGTAMQNVVTTADQPYLDQIAALRAETVLPEGVSLYDVNWDNLDPVTQEMYLRGLQSKYGIDARVGAWEQAKYALPGQSRAAMGMGY